MADMEQTIVLFYVICYMLFILLQLYKLQKGVKLFSFNLLLSTNAVN